MIEAREVGLLLGVRGQPHREHARNGRRVAVLALPRQQELLPDDLDLRHAIHDERLLSQADVHGDLMPSRAVKRLTVTRQSKARKQIHELSGLHGTRLLRLLATGACLVALLACGARSATGSLPAASAVQPEVQREIERAEQAERARDHVSARRHYEAAIARANGDARSTTVARREYAETLISWGELAAAATQLEAVVTVAPGDAASWHDLGLVRHGLDDRSGAIAALETAKRLAPRDPRPRVALAALRWQHGDLATARREYEELLVLDLPDRLREKVTWAVATLPATSPASSPSSAP
jgi:tetratricopeptide (TPR) repeat protein